MGIQLLSAKPDMAKSILIFYSLIFGSCTAILVSVVDLIVDRVSGGQDQLLSLGDPDLMAFFLGAIFFAPFFETLVFQFGLIEFLISSFQKKILAINLSALFFSLVHYNSSFSHSQRMIFVGYALAIIYCWMRSFSKKNAFILTFFTHTFHNLIIIAFFLVFHPSPKIL